MQHMFAYSSKYLSSRVGSIVMVANSISLLSFEFHITPKRRTKKNFAVSISGP